MIKIGIIGNPLGHSLSPKIHRHWLNKYNINAEYEILEIPPEELESTIKSLPECGFRGVNITTPYKVESMKYVNSVNECASMIGAINTIVVESETVGRNSDAFGYIYNLEQHPQWIENVHKPALVVGAGGAARAIVFGLLMAGVPEVRIYNRTFSNAEKISKDIGGIAVNEINFIDLGLLVNTTSIVIDEIDFTHLPKTTIVSDIITSPFHTPLLQKATINGNPILTGYGMLLAQAAKSFEMWFEIFPEFSRNY